ncbi:DUF4292 domain-containing protein [Mucilaginibacter sp.]|uniref:DUF4292 domain-containing protein n=1 Tax=Mucilaginibacter sp. TaxID=1882438 RepID=UPI003D0CEFB4
MKRNTLNKVLYKNASQVLGSIKLLSVCGLLLICSCKAKKQAIVKRVAVDSTVVKPVDTKAVKLNAIKSRQTNFNTFSGKAHTKLDMGNSSNDVTLNIRIKKDQKIWVSVTAIAGIEVARALITPDSIMLINRLQSLYVRKPFSYIYKFTGRQVNYKTLESLLIGNAVPELLNENSDFQTLNGNTTLSGSLQGMVYKLIIGADMKATQTNLNNQTAGQSLLVTNTAFIQTTNRIIPSQIDMASAVKDKKIQVNLHYIKADFDQPLEYPFSIPSRYSPAD